MNGPTAVSVTESQTLAGTFLSFASWLREAHSFHPGWGETSWTRKSGSLGNLGQTSGRLQITRDGLMEACQSEQRACTPALTYKHAGLQMLTHSDLKAFTSFCSFP